MTTPILAITSVKPQQPTSIKSAADITARYAKRALQTFTASPLLNQANQYGWLLARGAERQMVTSATVHGTGIMGFSTMASCIWALATELPVKIGDTVSKVSFPVLTENLMNIPFLNLASVGIGLSGLSALYCLDQFCDTIFGRSVLKGLIVHPKKLEYFNTKVKQAVS